MMNHVKYLTLLVCLLLMFSCKEDDNSITTLTIDKSELSFSQKGGAQTLVIESNSSWTITSPKPSITVSPSQGSGTQAVTVAVAKYDNPVAADESYTLIIRSDDGAKTVNVTIIIKGEFVGDKYIAVTNYAELTVGGEEHYEDVLLINTNVKWEIKGPEWIEAWDGARWRPLSTERGYVSGVPDDLGFSVLKVRTASANTALETREGTITVSETLSGSVPFTLRVWQVGREQVRPKSLLPLCNSFCTDWVCGNDVQSFYWYASSNNLTANELQNEKFFLEKFHTAYPDYVSFVNYGLQENSTMYLYTLAVTKNGTLAANAHSQQYQMPSSINQPRAPIEKAYKTDEGWNVKIGMNSLTSYYIYYVTSNQEIFNWSDVYLAWVLSVYSKKIYTEGTKAPFNMLNEPNESTLLVQDDIDIFTWAVGRNNAHSSAVVDRFNSTRDNERRVPAVQTSMLPVDNQIGYFRKSDHSVLETKIFRR